MPEAYCAHCGKAARHMIQSGWGVCKSCREGGVNTFSTLLAEVTNKETREWLKRSLREQD